VDACVLSTSAERKGSERALSIGVAFAEGENLARLLQNRPGNVATPSHLADVALGVAREYGFTSHVLGKKELEDEGMRALLAVSAGSEEEPRLIVLEHHGGEKGDPPLALVGKGITFDSGGISIKPGLGMEEMKFDMSGAAAVLGAMQAIGALRLPLNVVAVVPSAENLLSGRATKPGDIVRARSGKTIEIINTDAEGRLVLADALSYVIEHYAPKVVVDCATLTGACLIALGNHASAVLGNDEGVIAELREAGARAGERCWPLPLWKEYRKQLESTVADLKNVGGRAAGTITAAWFLAEFVGETPWAHLDIAGTAYGDVHAPYHRKGGFGRPARLLLEWLHARAG
jgi:leucyl aminopeptidase